MIHFPINANEAESRRVSRFGDTSHTQDVLRPAPYLEIVAHYIEQNRLPFLCDAPAAETNKSYPYTLDLRRRRKA